jgi:hypothetical protein|tara:strand:+ start:156 stop:422 length:267 start_codon:yes stop_codon:yes gene_type:complete
MNTDEHLEEFYQNVTHLHDSADELSCAGKTIVLFRVALECGSVGLGMIGALHLISRLFTAALGIMHGEDDPVFAEILEEFETDNETPH